MNALRTWIAMIGGLDMLIYVTVALQIPDGRSMGVPCAQLPWAPLHATTRGGCKT